MGRIEERARKLRAQIENLSDHMTDGEALENAELLPKWEQLDSTNPYMTGDKVTHNRKTWESEIDNNVWEPGVEGTEALWIEV